MLQLCFQCFSMEVLTDGDSGPLGPCAPAQIFPCRGSEAKGLINLAIEKSFVFDLIYIGKCIISKMLVLSDDGFNH